MPFQSELQLAIDAVRKASALCKRVQENLIDSDTDDIRAAVGDARRRSGVSFGTPAPRPPRKRPR